jgi:hypothetical protein
MDVFEPFVNLLVVFTLLSVTAERITNGLKMRQEELRIRKSDAADERERERAIGFRTLLVGVLLALLTKASLFEILVQLDHPWQALGWVRVADGGWTRSVALQSIGAFLYTFGGCVLTGLGLAFGSKFWHDLLGTVFEIRNIARMRSQTPAGGGEQSQQGG